MAYLLYSMAADTNRTLPAAGLEEPFIGRAGRNRTALRSISPKAAETCRGHFGIAHRVLDLSVP